MEIPLGSALLLVGAALLVLVVVLSAMAGLIYFLTGVIKDEESEEEAVEVPAKAVADSGAKEREVKKKVALIAVAIARAAQSRRVSTSDVENEMNSWRQLHLIRRLNQTLRVRRSP